jgi:hypothetical protein
MAFKLVFTPEADEQYETLKNDRSSSEELKAVNKCLAYLQTNPRHQSLQTHEFYSLKGPNGEKVFEAYAQQKRPAAYRIFWYYGPGRGLISIVSIVQHK